MTDLLTPTESELAALADGTLGSEHRERLLTAIEGSAELTAALDEQRRALELIDGTSVKAPESLHASVEQMIERSSLSRRDARRLSLHLPGAPALAGATAALAALAAVLIVALSGGGSRLVSVQQAAALTLSTPTMSAPGESPVHRSQLNVSVEGVSFPYWEGRFGWRSAGARIDRVAGRTVTTVFYSDRAGRRIGYAIVSGRTAPPREGAVHWRGGVPYRLLAEAGATVVAWPRAGHLCVVSGHGVDAATLLRLAWSPQDRTTA